MTSKATPRVSKKAAPKKKVTAKKTEPAKAAPKAEKAPKAKKEPEPVVPSVDKAVEDMMETINNSYYGTSIPPRSKSIEFYRDIISECEGIVATLREEDEDNEEDGDAPDDEDEDEDDDDEDGDFDTDE
jgi:hypothetical protein